MPLMERRSQDSSTASDAELARQYEEQVQQADLKRSISSAMREGLSGFVGMAATPSVVSAVEQQARRVLQPILGGDFDVTVTYDGEGTFDVVVKAG